MTHSMNGAVETRSNWKGLNAGLREVPSMAAMSFAVVGEGEDWNTRERALKSDRDERHPLRSVRVPSKRRCQRNDFTRGETWKAPQKLARKRKTENLSIGLCANTQGTGGASSAFIPNSYTN